MQEPRHNHRRVSPVVEPYRHVLTASSSLGHISLKVSTGYHGEQTETILQQMNNLAHFAADVLGDKYQTFDILPFRACRSTVLERF